MKLIENIVHKQIKNFLNESLTDIIYHFTDFRAAFNIVKTDTLLLSSILDRDERRDFDSKFNYYLSFTRQKNGNLGYSNDMDVRITFDGRKLSQKYKGGAYSFFTTARNRNFKNKFRTYDENEDRLYSNTPAIENVSKYIMNIDVLVKTKTVANIVKEMKKVATFPIHIYRYKKDYVLQNKNYTEDIENFFKGISKFEYPINEKEDGTAINCLIRMFKFFIGYFETKNIKVNREELISFYVDKYDLSKYKKYILKELSKEIPEYRVYRHFTSDFSEIRFDNVKLYIKITKIFMSLMKRTHKYSMKELIYDE